MSMLLRSTLAPWIKRRYRVRPENLDVIRSLRPPYLVLANHGSVWDPFMLGIFLPRIPNYVVSDANFRSKIVEFGLGTIGAIAKTKVMSDLDTIKNIMKVRDARGIICVFPEGQSTWDGHTLPLYYSTAKLAKLLRIPVVTARLKGAFLSRPRWSRKRRQGKVFVRYDLAFTPDQLKSASVEQIDGRIAELLEHDEFDYNRERQLRFVGPARAEYAEIALFMCPQCGTMDTMRSARNEFTCTACGYAVHVDLYGFFQPVSGALRFETMHDWNLWQSAELRRRLDALTIGRGDSPLFTEDVTMEVGYKSMPLDPFAEGRLELHADRIALVRASGETSNFPIRSIVGINIQNSERLEFYFEDTLYHVSAKDMRACTYKWDLAVRYMQELASKTAVV